MDHSEHPSGCDFSDSHLKPAPLRLKRKSQSRSDSNDYEYDAPGPESTPWASQTSEEPVTAHRENQTALRQPTPPLRTTSPALSALVSKFEMLGAFSNAKSKVPWLLAAKKLSERPFTLPPATSSREASSGHIDQPAISTIDVEAAMSVWEPSGTAED